MLVCARTGAWSGAKAPSGMRRVKSIIATGSQKMTLAAVGNSDSRQWNLVFSLDSLEDGYIIGKRAGRNEAGRGIYLANGKLYGTFWNSTRFDVIDDAPKIGEVYKYDAVLTGAATQIQTLYRGDAAISTGSNISNISVLPGILTSSTSYNGFVFARYPYQQTHDDFSRARVYYIGVDNTTPYGDVEYLPYIDENGVPMMYCEASGDRFYSLTDTPFEYEDF